MLKPVLDKFKRPNFNDNDISACPRCGGKGFIVVERRYVWAGKDWGDLGGIEDCPVCSRRAHCEKCGDFGVLRYDVPQSDPRFGKLYPCDACPKGQSIAEATLANALKGAGMPDLYRGLSFQSWKRLPARARQGKELPYTAAALYAMAWERGFEVSLRAVYERAQIAWDAQREDRIANSLVLEGEKGIGKTGLIASVCNYLVEKTPVRPLYIRCRDLVRDVQAQYKTGEATALEQAKNAELLVIDEMNLTMTSDDRKDILEAVIRHRHDNHMPTLVTLNTTRAEFEAEWGARTATVLFEMSHWLVVTGTPIRDEGAAVTQESR